jgi:cell division septation protein DedD
VTRYTNSVTVVAAFLSATLVAGCISSEGTNPGGGQSRKGPEKSIGPIDTTRTVVPSTPVVETKKTNVSAKRQSRSTKFTAKQDTLKASLVRRKKPTTALRLPKIERPANPAFTVQIGAFLRPNNALRNQKVAKSRFPEYPVYSNFDARSKFYRVSVGKFDSRHEALVWQKQMLKKYPKEYSTCWVNYIPK